MQPGQPGQPEGPQQGAPQGGYGQSPQAPYGQPPGGQPQMPAAPANPAQKPSIILLVCAAVLALGLFTKGWASASDSRFSVHVGMFGLDACMGSTCETHDWDEAAKRGGIPSDVSTFRIIGLICGILAIVVLCMAGGMGVAGNYGNIPIKPIPVVLGLASGSLTYFAFRLATYDADVDFGPSFSPFLAIGALIAAGVVFRKMLAPLIRVQQGMTAFAAPTGQAPMGQAPMAQAPMAQAPMAQAPMAQASMAQAPMAQAPAAAAAPQTPACATCGGATQYVEQYQRYYCPSCQQYV